MVNILTSPFQSPIISRLESHSFGDRRYQTLCGSFWWRPVWTKTCESCYSCIFKVEQALTEVPGKQPFAKIEVIHWSDDILGVMFHSGYWSLIQRKTEKCAKENDKGGRWTKRHILWRKIEEMEIFSLDKIKIKGTIIALYRYGTDVSN